MLHVKKKMAPGSERYLIAYLDFNVSPVGGALAAPSLPQVTRMVIAGYILTLQVKKGWAIFFVEQNKQDFLQLCSFLEVFFLNKCFFFLLSRRYL